MPLKSLVNKLSDYCKNHIWQCILVVIAEIMAFGFHATHYSYHVDMLVEEYYNGTVLIGAGRFSAPLINYLTNWMQFAPFWHTFLMAVILFVSGLIFGLLLKEASKDNLSDAAVFVFWIVFTTFPIVAYQMTFPILSVVLPYLLVGLALWLFLPIINLKKVPFKNSIGIVALLTISIDMYESHATVFLTMWFSILLVKSLISKKEKFNYILSSVKAVICLAISIVLDFAISKLVCKIFCGTFDFWYSKNTSIVWLEDPVVDCIKWIFREIIAQYIIAGTSNYSVFIFDIAVIVGFITTLIVSVKKRNAWCVILYIGAAVSSLSLAIVTGLAPLYRMAQALPIFVALFFAIIIKLLPEKSFTKGLIWGVVGIIVLNQTLFINRYTVLNYERHQYENHILLEISKDLQSYDIDSKPVLFIVNYNAEFPDFESTPLDLGNPLTQKYKNIMYKIFDKVIPQTIFRRIDARYGKSAGYELTNSENIDRFYNKDYKISPYVHFNQRADSPNYATALYKAELYRAFEKLGCSLIVAEEAMTTDKTKYPGMRDKYKDMPAYPADGYIIETPEKIIVKISE